MNRPSYYALLDDHTRKCLRLYSTFGFVGVVIREALAYIELLEDEIERRENDDDRSH
jgi:hypothetical protein